MLTLLNNAIATLAVAVSTTSATSCTVNTGEGAQFGSPSAENPVPATLVKMSGYEEIGWEPVEITAVSTDTLTLTRDVDGTGGLTFAIGDKIQCRQTKRSARVIVAEYDPNLLLATDFTKNPWQLGTTFTALASGSYGPDGFKVVHSSDGVVDIKQTADAPTIAQLGGYFTQHCLHADVTTADASIAAGQYYTIQHPIEGLKALRYGFGQSGTRNIIIPFWVKSTKTGIHCVAVQNSAANRSYVAEYTVNATNTWELKTVTIPADTTGTWLYTSGIGINVIWTLAVGATYQTAAGAWAAGNYFGSSNQVNCLDNTANDFKIAVPDFYQGNHARPYRSPGVDEMERMCQRYIEKSFLRGTAPAQNVGATTGEIQWIATVAGAVVQRSQTFEYKAAKRAAPTMTFYNPYAANAFARDGITGVDTTTMAETALGSTSGFQVVATTAAGTAVGNPIRVHYMAQCLL